MKRQIRRSVFETNSSNTHSLTICTEEEYDRWKKGELLYKKWEEKFVESSEYILTDEIKELAKSDYEEKKAEVLERMGSFVGRRKRGIIFN